VLETAENVTSSAVSEDLSVFVAGTSCGSLAFYKIEEKIQKSQQASPTEEIPLVPCKTIETDEKSEILGIRLIKNSSKIISISKSGTINQYNFDKTENTITLFSAQNCCVNFVTQVCQCVDSFLVLCDNTVVKSFSGSGSLLKTIDCKSEVSLIQSISPHMQGRSLLVNSENSDLLLYNLATGDLVNQWQLEPEKSVIKKITFLPNEETFVMSVFDKKDSQYYMRTYDLRKNKVNPFKKDKMRYKVSDIIVLNGPVQFMVVATERIVKHPESGENRVKTVLKVHKMANQFASEL